MTKEFSEHPMPDAPEGLPIQLPKQPDALPAPIPQPVIPNETLKHPPQPDIIVDAPDFDRAVRFEKEGGYVYGVSAKNIRVTRMPEALMKEGLRGGADAPGDQPGDKPINPENQSDDERRNLSQEEIDAMLKGQSLSGVPPTQPPAPPTVPASPDEPEPDPRTTDAEARAQAAEAAALEARAAADAAAEALRSIEARFGNIITQIQERQTALENENRDLRDQLSGRSEPNPTSTPDTAPTTNREEEERRLDAARLAEAEKLFKDQLHRDLVNQEARDNVFQFDLNTINDRADSLKERVIKQVEARAKTYYHGDEVRQQEFLTQVWEGLEEIKGPEVQRFELRLRLHNTYKALTSAKDLSSFKTEFTELVRISTPDSGPKLAELIKLFNEESGLKQGMGLLEGPYGEDVKPGAVFRLKDEAAKAAKAEFVAQLMASENIDEETAKKGLDLAERLVRIFGFAAYANRPRYADGTLIEFNLNKSDNSPINYEKAQKNDDGTPKLDNEGNPKIDKYTDSWNDVFINQTRRRPAPPAPENRPSWGQRFGNALIRGLENSGTEFDPTARDERAVPMTEITIDVSKESDFMKGQGDEVFKDLFFGPISRIAGSQDKEPKLTAMLDCYTNLYMGDFLSSIDYKTKVKDSFGNEHEISNIGKLSDLFTEQELKDEHGQVVGNAILIEGLDEKIKSWVKALEKAAKAKKAFEEDPNFLVNPLVNPKAVIDAYNANDGDKLKAAVNASLENIRKVTKDYPDDIQKKVKGLLFKGACEFMETPEAKTLYDTNWGIHIWRLGFEYLRDHGELDSDIVAELDKFTTKGQGRLRFRSAVRRTSVGSQGVGNVGNDFLDRILKS